MTGIILFGTRTSDAPHGPEISGRARRQLLVAMGNMFGLWPSEN